VGDRILVGIGRAPNVEGIGLEAAGVRYDASGVVVTTTCARRTAHLRGSDVASRFKFTHVADALARIVVQNALFGTFGRKKASALVVPWCTYTTPRWRTSARPRGRDGAQHRGNHHRRSAARERPCAARRRGRGFLRVHLRKGSDRIVGATLVAAHAGDMMSE